MVKRKANKSLDEWLSEGELVSAVKQLDSKITIESCTVSPSPVAEIAQPQVASEPLAVATTEVDITENEAASWFWSLLRQTGYECW